MQKKIDLLRHGMMSLVGHNCVDRVIMVVFPFNFFIELLKGYFGCWRDLVLPGSDCSFMKGYLLSYVYFVLVLHAKNK